MRARSKTGSAVASLQGEAAEGGGARTEELEHNLGLAAGERQGARLVGAGIAGPLPRRAPHTALSLQLLADPPSRRLGPGPGRGPGPFLLNGKILV